MKSLRPLAGALLATLMLIPVVSAAEVELLLPGGGSEASSVPKDGQVSILPVPNREKPKRPPSGSDTEPVLQTRHFGAMAELTCSAADSPNALLVVNNSADPLPPGTRIKWQLGDEQGFFRLIGELEGGATLVADNVLEGPAGGGNCVARII
ncbi:MAG: hypothetical protein ACO1OG_03410 [Devosia sp.]